MALDLWRYWVSENSSKRPIIGRHLKPDVFLEDKAAKMRLSDMIPAAYHVHIGSGPVSGVRRLSFLPLAHSLACARVYPQDGS